MKNARRGAVVALCGALCLFGLAPRAHADNSTNPINPAMTDQPLSQPAIVVALQKATDGLLMPSETDAPFKVVFFAREAETAANGDAETDDAKTGDDKTEGNTKTKANPVSVQELAKLAGAPDDAKIETRDLDEFFAVAATIEEWMNDEEKSTAARFAALLEILKTQIKGAQVLVWGEAEKQVAIIGEAEGGLAGVTTRIVAT